MDIRAELAAILASVRRPGDFSVSGRLKMRAPRLIVDGVGEIALPLLPAQAEQLVAQAERAPYGRGERTLVDTRVRRTWQIAPSHLHLTGKHWPATLERVLARVSEGLGIEGPICAELYKLLIYDEGSFFVSHRDSEKAPGMFATLVLALPSASSGGELAVRHRDREARLDLANEDPGQLTYAAFYADCVHEVLPITAGYRAALIYNLRRGGTEAPVPAAYAAVGARIASLLRGWCAGQHKDAPEKIVYPLEHAYTPAELGFAGLKGADAAAAALLKPVASAAGCELHLALLSIQEGGAAGHTYRGPGSMDHFEVLQVFHRTQELSQWRSPEGDPVSLGMIPLQEEETSPPDVLDNMEPDEEHFEESTGNEGASFERTYQRAVLTLWPRHRRLAVITQAGPLATLTYLESLAARWAVERGGQDSPTWLHAAELAGHMLDTWPVPQHWQPIHGHAGGLDPQQRAQRQRLAHVIAALTVLEDDPRIRCALELLAAHKGHDLADHPAILGALARFSAQERLRMLEAIVRNQAAQAFGECCRLLLAADEGLFAQAPGKLTAAATALIAVLPADSSGAPGHYGQPPASADPAVIADLVTLLQRIDANLAVRLSQQLLVSPKTYDLDQALIPALTRLIQAKTARSDPAMSRLVSACLAHLKARAAMPLTAPMDWSRPAKIGCSCPHCKTLSSFLKSPDTLAWTFRGAKHDRSHVYESILQAGADLDVTTDRSRKPPALICRKNSASYERRVKQRSQDLADIGVLEGR